MIVLLVAQTAALLLLGMLVAGLLRSHAEILRRLHEMGAGRPEPDRSPHARHAQGTAPAHDLSGVSTADEALVVRVSGMTQETLLVFLSSGCATCDPFWERLGRPEGLPSGIRLVVVTRGPESESPARVAALAAPGLTVLMSDAAWRDYRVPGSPYFVYVSGGRVRGEGTARSWVQLTDLLGAALGDVPHPAGGGMERGADAFREARADRELIKAGIYPGHPSLYGEEPEGNGSG